MQTLRRVLLRALPLVALAATAPSCKQRKPPEPDVSAQERATTAAPEAPSLGAFVVKFLYGGAKEDGGFNQAQASAAAALAKLRDVKVLEEENVDDGGADAALEKAAGVDGASLVFATAFGHFDPPVIAAAPRHPRVTYLHCGGYYQEAKHPANAASYHAYLDEAFYVAGVTAGLTTRTRKLGFVASKALPHVVRNLNAFTLGARSVSPKVTTTVVFMNTWSAPGKEAAAANALVDKGVDVLAMYVDAPRMLLETAEKRGIYSVGVHVDGTKHAPKGYLTGAEWRWTGLFADYVKKIRAHRPFPRVLRGGLREGYVDLSPFGPAVPQKVREQAAMARAQIVEDKLVVFKGPLKDNAGKLVLQAGQQLIRNDIQLELATFLVEGVVGTLPE